MHQYLPPTVSNSIIRQGEEYQGEYHFDPNSRLAVRAQGTDRAHGIGCQENLQSVYYVRSQLSESVSN